MKSIKSSWKLENKKIRYFYGRKNIDKEVFSFPKERKVTI